MLKICKMPALGEGVLPATLCGAYSAVQRLNVISKHHQMAACCDLPLNVVTRCAHVHGGEEIMTLALRTKCGVKYGGIAV